MKKSFTIIAIISILSSCSIDYTGEKDVKISELEKQIQVLTIENTNLKEENMLLKAGGIPSTVQTSSSSGGTTVVGANSLFPEGSTFEETNGAECMKKAYNTYISEGVKKCKSLGYTDTQIKKDECQLDTSYIKTLEKQRTDAEAACGPQ